MYGLDMVMDAERTGARGGSAGGNPLGPGMLLATCRGILPCTQRRRRRELDALEACSNGARYVVMTLCNTQIALKFRLMSSPPVLHDLPASKLGGGEAGGGQPSA